MASDNIYYNVGKDRIMIVLKWHADPLGGPAIYDTTISLLPGDGIDLTAIGLEKRPKTKKAKREKTKTTRHR